jgi:hypothetical protein
MRLAPALQFNNEKGRYQKMSKKLLTLMIAVTFIVSILTPMTVMARQGGSMSGQTQMMRTKSNLQIRNQQRLRDGSCANVDATTVTAKAQKKGKTYGPGDGTGNSGVGPQDGTGYGAPSTK